MQKEEITINEEKPEDPVSTVTAFLFDWAVTIFTAIAVILLIMNFAIRQVRVDGPSMQDTLHNDDRLIVYNFMYTPADGDIVIATHGDLDFPGGYDEPIIKRVIATEGQTIDIDFETGSVTVDGIVQEEDYIKGITKRTRNTQDFPLTVPKGYAFVMGDNRENSLDSRSKEVGLIPRENIIGKAVFRIFPFDKFGTV